MTASTLAPADLSSALERVTTLAATGKIDRAGLRALRDRLADEATPWDKPGLAAAMKAALVESGLKMPQLAPAVRVLVCGRAQTPSIDAVLALFAREDVLSRLQHI